jgi:hypothetical protein
VRIEETDALRFRAARLEAHTSKTIVKIRGNRGEPLTGKPTSSVISDRRGSQKKGMVT